MLRGFARAVMKNDKNDDDESNIMFIQGLN